MGLHVEPRLLFGRIVDCVAYGHLYKVQLERSGQIILCTSSGQGTFQLVGARVINTYNYGCGVIVFYHPQSPLGFILCALPDFMFDGTSGMADFLVQGSNVGLRTDGVHKFPFFMAGAGGLEDRSGGRPFDSLPVGEWGAITETGLAFFLDPFLAYMRVDEETGLFLFYHDQLARLAGHNLQIWSAGRQREELDDQNEFIGEEGWTHQLFEARGTFGPLTGTAVSRSYGSSDTQVASPWYSALEPAYDDQVPFHRRRSYRGYLGQGGTEVLALPPVGAYNDSFNRLSEPPTIPGAFEEGVGVDGTYALRSAKSVIISKCPNIPVPARKAAPDDPEGDTPTDYKFAGIYGSGPSHSVHDISGPSSGTPSQVRAAAVADYYDFVFNWKAWRHAFHYHTLDWYLPDESGMPMESNMASGVPSYGSLATQQYLPTPTSFTLKVDERYGNIIYFPNNAFIALLEDGGIMFVDGWGSEFLMSAGSIRQSCAGDHWVVAGRNANVLAGYDVIQRANNEVNLTANLGNVRVEAYQSVMALAGNGGCGGFLFESRAIQAGYAYDAHNPVCSGFLVRCKESPVVLLGADMLISTRYPSQGGHIVLDAGTAKTMLHGSDIELQATYSVLLAADGTAFEFWSDEANFGADVGIDGKLVATDCGMFGTSVSSPTVAGSLATYTSGVASTVTTAKTAVADRATVANAYAVAALADIQELYTAAPAIVSVQFEHRDQADYLTTGMSFYEPRWHQIARLSGQTLAYWTETPCTDDAANVTYPYPGKTVWLGSHYAKENLALHNQVTNLAADRGSTYETAAYDSPSFVVMDGNFPVIVNPS
jgi:hypothetical protein